MDCTEKKSDIKVTSHLNAYETLASHIKVMRITFRLTHKHTTQQFKSRCTLSAKINILLISTYIRREVRLVLLNKSAQRNHSASQPARKWYISVSEYDSEKLDAGKHAPFVLSSLISENVVDEVEDSEGAAETSGTNCFGMVLSHDMPRPSEPKWAKFEWILCQAETAAIKRFGRHITLCNNEFQ